MTRHGIRGEESHMSAPDVIGELDARFSDPDAMATSWADVDAMLEKAELFWITTVRPDGRPHVAPLVAVWLDRAVYFCSGADEQKSVNLRANPHCALTTGNNGWKIGLDIVIEGPATPVTDESRLQVLADAWESKYEGDWHYDVHDGAFVQEGGAVPVFEVVPDKILAFAKGDFAQTRFRLPS
jgi:general stress protein 26